MPSKATLMSFLNLLLDLVLSFIGYYTLVYVIYMSTGRIAWIFFSPGWTFHPFWYWRDDIMMWMILSLWVARFILRWRGHFACAWRYFACILRWLSPLSPKPYEACPCCETAMREVLASGEDEQDDENLEQRGIGIFL